MLSCYLRIRHRNRSQAKHAVEKLTGYTAPCNYRPDLFEPVLRTGEPDATKRNCFDCRNCKGAVSWWCTHPDAIKKYGRIPGRSDCEHWTPCRTKKELSIADRAGAYLNIIYIDR